MFFFIVLQNTRQYPADPGLDAYHLDPGPCRPFPRRNQVPDFLLVQVCQELERVKKFVWRQDIDVTNIVLVDNRKRDAGCSGQGRAE